jgi:hypothetical protein
LLASGAAAGAAAALVLVARPWYLGWGATDAERARALPGDELVPQADLVATRVVTVDAPPDRVWPWVAQMGQGRGGFYSYEALENLVGCEIHSADSIHAEWQEVAVGDAFRLHPDVSLEVATVEPGRALVVRGGVPMGGTAPPYDFTWAFVLEAAEADSTRLVVRERYGYTRWWARLLVEAVEVVSFVMSHKMLLGIRRRAEGAAR